MPNIQLFKFIELTLNMKQMKLRNCLLVSFLTIFFAACAHSDIESKATQWSTAADWYQPAYSSDTSKVDVFYLVSTDVLTAKNESGGVSYLAMLTPDDKKNMDEEFGFIKKNIFQDDFNFIAPYYHQFTFEAISLPADTFNILYKDVADEVCGAFDYYMRYQNNGRRFILAGFSQGAMLTLDLLKHLTDEQYSRMVAAYVIGYRLSAEDLSHPHIKAATGEGDPHAVISFNSVLSNAGIWNFVTQGAVTCINPLNWRTDSTPAELSYEEDSGTVHIDTTTHVLIVNMANNEKYRKYMDDSPVYSSVNHDNLHHWEPLFYANTLHQNAMKRAYGNVLAP